MWKERDWLRTCFQFSFIDKKDVWQRNVLHNPVFAMNLILDVISQDDQDIADMTQPKKLNIEHEPESNSISIDKNDFWEKKLHTKRVIGYAYLFKCYFR